MGNSINKCEDFICVNENQSVLRIQAINNIYIKIEPMTMQGRLQEAERSKPVSNAIDLYNLIVRFENKRLSSEEFASISRGYFFNILILASILYPFAF